MEESLDMSTGTSTSASTSRIQGKNESQAIPVCLGCTHQTRSECDIQVNSIDFKCQEMIDSIYRSCNGVTLPRNYYFDPPVRQMDL